MGLQLSKTIKGIDCNYWSVIKCMCNYEMGECLVWLGLYVNEQAMHDNIKNYFDVKLFQVHPHE